MMRKKQYFEIEIKNMNNMVFLLRKYNKRVVAAMLYKYKFDNILIKLTEARAEKWIDLFSVFFDSNYVFDKLYII